MKTQDIRTTFTEYFAANGHAKVPSASLIPHNPNLLLTIAGMVPFMPYFLGEATPPWPRATTIQKSARTNDIENVGRTARHLTFFEMLGNFSFGDYFKADAIRWAYELSVTPASEGGLGFDPERIWATVFEEDDETEALWLAETDIPAARIQRRGPEDNFWGTGGAGPCGPCTEIFYDRGPDHGQDGGPIVDETRFTEFWNLVFMQYETDGKGNPKNKGSDSIKKPLPMQNVDTGSGLERVAMLLQDVPTIFDTDEMAPLITLASQLTSTEYQGRFDPDSGDTEDVWLRVIAEHARATSFLIGDGVLPSNEGRGYVLRRLIRRAVNAARKLGTDTSVMPQMVSAVIDTYAPAYRDLQDQATLITKVVASEEEAFSKTLRTGLTMLGQALDDTVTSGEKQLDAATAFTLHDTYGFPVDLTIEIAAEKGVALDRDAFAEHMEAQRARAKAATKSNREAGETDVLQRAFAAAGTSRFTGYETEVQDSVIAGMFAGDRLLEHAEEGDEVSVLLRDTPFYAEGGGQLGDHGVIVTPLGRIAVTDTIAPSDGLIVHRGVIEAGEVAVGEEAVATIDAARRMSIRRGHTATHILHATIKEMVGDHAAQAGSAIDQGHFRFDFPHFEAVSPDQLAELEGLVNGRISANPDVVTREMSQEDARAAGATALFGEKYGDTVRVVTIDDYSMELCGGTHVTSTGEVGLFTVLSEGSVANNVRRIEAVTGPEAFAHLSKERMIAGQVARLLNVSSMDAPDRVAALLERVKDVEKQLAESKQRAVLGQADVLLDSARNVGDVTVVSGVIDGADGDTLRTLAQNLRDRVQRGVVVVGTATEEGKAVMVAALTSDVVDAGTNAADVLRPGAKLVGGGAGGKGEIAQAGGKDGGKIAEAIDAAVAEAVSRLG